MAHTFADSRRWMTDGTTLLADEVAGLTEQEYDAPTLLPGWTRRHLVAHVAANADALGHLVHWAATGDETPMYSSPQDRAAGIERGTSMSADELGEWLHGSADRLAAAMAELSDEQWAAPVVTAQGRTVPATETPWMRSREVWVHVVDLDRGHRFEDLPPDFLTALVEDITARRGEVPPVDGPLPQVAAWLAGRPHTLTDAPALAPWL
ncbi:maleylpyruvate isomerase family mycothiol-dependent enzyme [Allobranchiibius huperziae]|uniref:Maleylpyruvate isomerase n=1 Tax=Allobranchiibius huperziae TaxID=1874116 RepID=A0A853D9J1_9MICO|nr:maleylpyruvate isomerase family mycothiol-dependent enzyme [Allobranchiibius huperziae]NYJ73628.1 maleylpyruvate isomerase [Allobranchiibius huperziae]